MWTDTSLLGLVFLLSGASTAAALIILIARRRRWLSPGLTALAHFDSWVLAAELVALVALVFTVGWSVFRHVWMNWWGVLFLVGGACPWHPHPTHPGVPCQVHDRAQRRGGGGARADRRLPAPRGAAAEPGDGPAGVRTGAREADVSPRYGRLLVVVAPLALPLAACTTPEATRMRGGGPGADPGNRSEIVKMHEGSRPYLETPRLIEPYGHPELGPARQAHRRSLRSPGERR